MSELLTIPGLDSAARELLEAAGFHDFTDLARADDGKLTKELEKANRILKLCGSDPPPEAVAGWVSHARQKTGISGGAREVPLVDYEKEPHVQAMLRCSPLAIPLPATALGEKNLSVSDLPEGLLISEYRGELDVRSEKKIPRPRSGTDDSPSYVHVVDQSNQSRLDIDVSRLKSVRDAGPKRLRAHAVVSQSAHDRVELIRAPRESTNKGRNPNSRRYIRGVLHTHPAGIYAGAVLTLIMVVFTPVAVVSAFLLLLSREMPDAFGWVGQWILVFPIVLPLLSIAWLIWGFSGKCRICTQKLFIHRPHLKNAKAHYVPLVGYVIPLCIHILLFHWFRCSHCGTPVRLKK